MVKVEDSYQKEQQDQENFRIAIDITNKIFPGARINEHDDIHHFSVEINKKKVLEISLLMHRIHLYSLEYFNPAMRLAEEYENLIKGEITLERHYKS